jgi:quinoprotein glucose dehydrogenase
MRIAIFLLTAAALYGQNSAGDWPMFNRDLAGTRFSPVTQINAKNVRLTRAWSYKLNPWRGSKNNGRPPDSRSYLALD